MEYKMSVLLKNTSLNHLSKLQNFPFLKMRHYLRGLYIAKLFNTLYYKKKKKIRLKRKLILNPLFASVLFLVRQELLIDAFINS